MEQPGNMLDVNQPEKKKRPSYLAFLAGYLAIYGGLMLVLQLLAYKNITAAGESLGISPLALLIVIIFLGVVSIAAGVGLWLGKKWGWWLSVFYFLYMFARELSAVLSSGALASAGTSALINAGLGILLSVIVTVYLYKREILEHFRLEKFPKWLSLLILAAAVIVVSILI